MDFKAFRSAVVQVPVTFTDGADTVEFWVGYRPREILEEDLELLAKLQSARVADVDLPAQPAPRPNRASRRAAERGKPAAPPPPSQPEAPGLIEHMKRLIASWSLTWDDEPWPVTEENFRLIEPMMRAAIVAAIVEHYIERPNLMNSSPSSSADAASGPTGPTSASEPSSGAAASSPGPTPV